MQLGRLLRSSSLQAALGFGVGGVAFAVGNLLLARALPVSEYGKYSLAVALFNTFWMTAPLGFDEGSLRRHSRLGLRAFARVTLSGGGVALLAALVGRLVYQLDLATLGFLAAAIMAAGYGAMASALLRRTGAQTSALAVNNSANWAVIVCGAVSLLLALKTAELALIGLVVGVSLGAIGGWLQARRLQARSDEVHEDVPLNEALNFVSILAAGAVIVQLERLVAPKVLGVEALANFAVLASVALFPFRMLRSGVGFSLAPKLRRAATIAERNRIIVHEIGAVVAVLSVASLAVMVVAPPLTEQLTSGKYQLSLALVAAACLNGAAKVLTGLPRAFITASGTSADLRALNWQSWLMIVCSGGGAWLGAQVNLTGLVLGAGLGAILGALPSLQLARQVLRRSEESLSDARPEELPPGGVVAAKSEV
ncbi:hypothetical protein LJR225_001517 [Phenylobacterium sp. LjRoot225]|uniref:lipopolysaccharide biosynthesis protein n=1 Tax=Phenylobacterium sp. LjRoot225 TaxID=3342285 RepID=UPI003ECED483